MINNEENLLTAQSLTNLNKYLEIQSKLCHLNKKYADITKIQKLFIRKTSSSGAPIYTIAPNLYKF